MAMLFAILLLAQTPGVCADVRDCRQQALDAAAAGDYERFHDLAWRAVQKGRPNDPDLMYVLARAQALSGRPGDALVMLQRLTDMGVATDAATSEDFRRVRDLNGWSDLEAKMAALGAPRMTAAAPAAAPRARAAGESSEETLSFTAPSFEPVGLAYDAVSRRFIVGDRQAGRLIVIDEMSHHVTNLVSAASAGFYDTITAFEIDARHGDLWVASAKSDGAESVLHKLQLVSGRVLEEVRFAAGKRSRIVDMAVGSDGTVILLDSEDGRILRLRPRARALEEAVKLPSSGARSLAIADDRTVYVASDQGISRADLVSRAVVAVHGPRNLDLTLVDKIRCHDGGLVMIQREIAGESHVIRARLDASAQALTNVQVHTITPRADPRAATLAGAELYYLVSGSNGSSIRRATVK
jgi:hypothetical protein